MSISVHRASPTAFAEFEQPVPFTISYSDVKGKKVECFTGNWI